MIGLMFGHLIKNKAAKGLAALPAKNDNDNGRARTQHFCGAGSLVYPAIAGRAVSVEQGDQGTGRPTFATHENRHVQR